MAKFESDLTVLTEKVNTLIKKQEEALAKSTSPWGYPGANRDGQQGANALANINVDPVLITLIDTDAQLYATKNIKKTACKSTTAEFLIQNSELGDRRDLAISESGMPTTENFNIIKHVEFLKYYGVRAFMSDVEIAVNDAGGIFLDTQVLREKNSLKQLAVQAETEFYIGSDYFIDASGDIDFDLPRRWNSRYPTFYRHCRGVQNQCREGNANARGYSLDWEAFANSVVTILNIDGSALDQTNIDQICTAIGSNAGMVGEAHLMIQQANALRNTFFPYQRGDIASKFEINGPKVSVNPQQGFPILTSMGVVQFIPVFFKAAMKQHPKAAMSADSQIPTAGTPAVSMGSPIAGATNYKVNDVIRYYVEAYNSASVSSATTLTYTILADGDQPTLTITAQASTEGFNVFATPASTSGAPGSEGFIGRIRQAASGNTTFVDKQAIHAGTEPVVFMPSEGVVEMLTLGQNLVKKTELARRGTVLEWF